MKLKNFMVNSLPRVRSRNKKRDFKDKNDNVVTFQVDVYNDLMNDATNVTPSNGHVTNKNDDTRLNDNSAQFLYRISVDKYRIKLNAYQSEHYLSNLHNEVKTQQSIYCYHDRASVDDCECLPRRSNIRTNPWCTPKAKRTMSSVTSSRSTLSSLTSSFVSFSTSTETSDTSMSTSSDVSFCADDGYGSTRSCFLSYPVREQDECSWIEDGETIGNDIPLPATVHVGDNNVFGSTRLNIRQKSKKTKSQLYGQPSQFIYEDNLNHLLESEELKTGDSQVSLNELISDNDYKKPTTLENIILLCDYSFDSLSENKHVSDANKNRNNNDECDKEEIVVNNTDRIQNKSLTTGNTLNKHTPRCLRDTQIDNKSDKQLVNNPVDIREETQTGTTNYISSEMPCTAKYSFEQCISEEETDDTMKVVKSDSGRCLDQITSSLAQKVSRLREEKLIVRQKIREAQEEERIRVRETNLMHRHISVNRKKVLLKTLEELKDRLEAQTGRLQISYDAILSIQQKVSPVTSLVTYIL